jgi:hypothetical protein
MRYSAPNAVNRIAPTHSQRQVTASTRRMVAVGIRCIASAQIQKTVNLGIGSE